MRRPARSEPAPGSEKPCAQISSAFRMRGRYCAFCASVPQWMIVGPTRFSPMPGSTGARAAAYSSSQITRSMIEAPRPPYSGGHAMPTQPALCIAFCQAQRRSNPSRSDATRSSTGSSTTRSGGRLAASQPRNSLRNASCSGVYSKSMVSEPVQRAGVVAEDPLPGAGRHVLEVVLDGLARLRPRAVGVGIIRRPHHAIVAEDVEQTQADVIRLEGRPHLALEVPARLHGEGEPAVALPELGGVDELVVGVVEPLEHVGQPADAGLGQDDPQPRVALERAREDDRG